MTQSELNKILEKHKEWLKDSTKGERACLARASLEGAYLEGANLYGAKGLITFQCGQHTAYFTYNNHIMIGCEYHTISHWLENYKEIGRINGYSKSQIESYGNFIKRCAKKQKEQA